MTASKRNLIFTVLNSCYGTNAAMVKAMIREELETHANHERTFFQAATVAAPRCASFLQAQNLVQEWVAA